MTRRSRHGEWKFGELCHSQEAICDVVVNKSCDDEHGWDHVVDISPPVDINLPADLRNHLYQCFAQIKTTNGKIPRAELKLSNAIKSAKSPFPSFIFLLQYLDKSSEPRVFGRHIWRNEIEDWLRRARMNDVLGKKDLRSERFGLKFEEGDIVYGPPGDWMYRLIEDHGGINYSRNKIDIFTSIGYGETTHEGTITFGPIDGIGDIVRHEIGLSDGLPFCDLKLFDTRFGIRSAFPIEDFVSGGRISFRSEGRHLTLRLFCQDGRTCDIPAISWASSIVPIGDPEFRFRVKAGPINLVTDLQGAGNSISISLDQEEKMTPLEMLGLLCLLQWSQAGSVKYAILCDMGKIFSGSIDGMQEQGRGLYRLEATLRHLIDLMGDRHSRELCLSATELEKLSSNFYLAETLCAASIFKIKATFDREIADFRIIGAYSAGAIGNWSFGAIYQAKVNSSERLGGSYTFTFSSMAVVEKFQLKCSPSRMREIMLSEFSKWTTAQEGPVGVISGGNIDEMTSSLNSGSTIELKVFE